MRCNASHASKGKIVAILGDPPKMCSHCYKEALGVAEVSITKPSKTDLLYPTNRATIGWIAAGFS